MSKPSAAYTRSRRIGMLGGGAAVFFSLGFFSSWLWLKYAPSSDQTVLATSPTPSVPIRLGMDGLINPLLEYTVANSFPSEISSLDNDLRMKVNSLLSAHLATTVGIFYEDLNSGRWAGVNLSERFSPASLLKVPTMITYLKLAEIQPDILTQSILYDGSRDSNAIEDIKPLKVIQAGHFYTVDELLKFMIDYSDNNATDLLYTNDLQSSFDQTYTDLGLPVPTSTNDFLTPRQYSRFFRILYNATYLNQSMSKKALSLLTYADFPYGIMAGVPEGITVADKFGEHQFDAIGVDELHDCGIVYYPGHPYAICIMTKGNNFDKLTNAISDVSSMIYQKVKSEELWKL